MVKTAKPTVYMRILPKMSAKRPMSGRSTVVASAYACVIQMACSASAPSCAATCGKPTMIIRASTPTKKMPRVVTVNATHL